MIKIKADYLRNHREVFFDLAMLAEESVGRDPEIVSENFNLLASRGARVLLMYEDGKLIGGTVFGRCDLFLNWGQHIELYNKLKEAGYEPNQISLSSHIYLVPGLWKKGYHRKMLRARGIDCLAQGWTGTLILGCATKQLSDYLYTLPGAHKIDLVDSNGFPVGVMSWKEFLEQTDVERLPS